MWLTLPKLIWSDSNHVVTKSVGDEIPGRWGWGYVQLISVQMASKSIFLCFAISRPCVSWTKHPFWAKLSVSSYNPPCVGMVRSACSIHLSPRNPLDPCFLSLPLLLLILYSFLLLSTSFYKANESEGGAVLLTVSRIWLICGCL